MKSDVAFALENAGWPALLVDGAGAIRRANAAAVPAFSAQPWPGSLRGLAAVWSPENSSTAEQFLAQWERSAVPDGAAQIPGQRRPGGLLSHVGLRVHQRRPEVFRAPVAAGVRLGGGSEAGRRADAGLAHKQKLDCALQLARTVALDFNNALTSILGHTSLILSKMEPNHPWRGSLIEVEKSAAKAAEIANDLGTFSRQEKEARTQAAGNLNPLLQRSVEFFQQNAGAGAGGLDAAVGPQAVRGEV